MGSHIIPSGGGGYTEGASVFLSFSQSIPDDTTTTLAFASEVYDTDEIHDNVTNNSRLTCKTAGKYLIIGSIQFAGNATGYRRADIIKDGAYLKYAKIGGLGTDAPQFNVAVYEDLAVGEYIEMNCRQNSGGALNAGGGARFYTSLAMHRIG